MVFSIKARQFGRGWGMSWTTPPPSGFRVWTPGPRWHKTSPSSSLYCNAPEDFLCPVSQWLTNSCLRWTYSKENFTLQCSFFCIFTFEILLNLDWPFILVMDKHFYRYGFSFPRLDSDMNFADGLRGKIGKILWSPIGYDKNRMKWWCDWSLGGDNILLQVFIRTYHGE